MKQMPRCQIVPLFALIGLIVTGVVYVGAVYADYTKPVSAGNFVLDLASIALSRHN